MSRPPLAAPPLSTTPLCQRFYGSLLRLPMAEQKKPKIDLKARLRKQRVSSPSGSSIPPPVVGKGIPAPPFGRPKVDASNPYAAVESAQAKAKPQAIRVEMSQEVVEAQKKVASEAGIGFVTARCSGCRPPSMSTRRSPRLPKPPVSQGLEDWGG